MTEREFKVFFDNNWRGHLYFAKQMLPYDSMAAEDAVGVAYMQAWEGIKNGKFIKLDNAWGAIANYIRKAIVGKILDYTKHLKRGGQIKQELRYISIESFEPLEIKSELLNLYCSELSSQQKKALQLYIDGYNYKDMSAVLNIHINTCYTYVKRGLDKIRSKIGYTKPPRIGADRSNGLDEKTWASRQNNRLNPYAI